MIYARIYAGSILSTSQAPTTEEYNCHLCSQIRRLAPRENAALDICIGTLYRLYHSSLNKLNPLHLMKCAHNAPKRTSSTGHAVPSSKVVYEEEKLINKSLITDIHGLNIRYKRRHTIYLNLIRIF